MKSVTSFFDFHTFRKDATRFAPLWILYLIGGTLVMLAAIPRSSAAYSAMSLIATISPFCVINLVYACMVAMLLFGDLFNSRLCNALHAMPLRREQWFVSHFVSGIAFSVVPNLIGISVLMPMLKGYWYTCFIWLGGMTLQYIFFFGLAVFCVFCTGNRFAMAAVYALINFASMLAVFFIANIYEPLMFGIQIDYTPLSLLCPVVHLAESGAYEEHYVLFEHIPNIIPRGSDRHDYYAFAGFGEGWLYLWIMAAAGVGFTVAALLMYRRRALETAGDFIAVRPLAPIFSIVYTLAMGALFALMEQLITGDYGVFLAVGIIVGYFTGQMLLQRTIKVLKVKNFLKCGGVLLLLLISIGLTYWDLLGISRFVPAPENVKSVSVTLRYGSDAPLELTDPEDIRLITEIHQEYVEIGRNSNPSPEDRVGLEIHYTMKNGATNSRVYVGKLSEASKDVLRMLFSRPEHVLGYAEWDWDWEQYLGSVVGIQMNASVQYDPRSLLEAVKADCEAGNMVQNWRFHNSNEQKYWIEIDYAGGKWNCDIGIYPDAVHTIQWIKENTIVTDVTK